MGKPFDKELESVGPTLEWAFSEPIGPALRVMFNTIAPFPLMVVGSGGSLTAAHFVLRLHQQVTGQEGKAITPLELFYSNINPGLHAVLFISAGGNNKDILQAFRLAIEREFGAIAVLCANLQSKIGNEARKYPYVKVFEYNNPAGRDGFLAVNSLLATCILAGRAYTGDSSKSSIKRIIRSAKKFRIRYYDKILSRRTIVALGAEWAWPALVDLESKFTEAALGNVIISDLKNFGHGRHHWFDKKGDESALLVLETPALSQLVKKTLGIIPDVYPKTVLRSFFADHLACIDLLNQISLLVKKAGERDSIDPGKPKVLSFGRKLYHVSIPHLSIGTRIKNRNMWIERKVRASRLSHEVTEKFLDQFLISLKHTRFAGIVFDYDGTLCDQPERYEQPKKAIGKHMNTLLSGGIPVGVATGRGKSVQNSLRRVIAKRYWEKVLVGNYNGMVVLPLSSDVPRFDAVFSDTMLAVNKLLGDDRIISGKSTVEMNYKHISVAPNSNLYKEIILKRILELLATFRKIKVVQSDHSFDITDEDISKRNVVKRLRIEFLQEADDILVVGDQGQYGGNDFELLNKPLSLSVDRVSSSPHTCWNLSPPGIRGAEAIEHILQAVRVRTRKFRLDIGYLEKARKNGRKTI